MGTDTIVDFINTDFLFLIRVGTFLINETFWRRKPSCLAVTWALMKMKTFPQMMIFWTKNLEAKSCHLMKNSRNRSTKFICKCCPSQNKMILWCNSCSAVGLKKGFHLRPKAGSYWPLVYHEMSGALLPCLCRFFFSLFVDI